MNKKAESFKQFLDENKIVCFTVDEIKDDKFDTVVFRSSIEINGQKLPAMFVADNSIYCIIRILIAPKALTDDNAAELQKTLNGLNKTYKAFKYYFDDSGNLVLDCCVLCSDETVNGNLIYSMFDLIINHLNTEYKNLMKQIWQ